MSKELIDKLSNLTLERNCLKRELDKNFNRDYKTKVFLRIKALEKEIDFIKFKLILERKMRNEKSR